MHPPVSSTLTRPSTGRLAAARDRYHRDGSVGLTGGRLVVALYQRLLRDLDQATAAIETGDVERAHHELVHAQEIVDSLDAALDASVWDAADSMSALYDFVRRQLLDANVTKTAPPIAAARRVLEPLASGWEAALDLTANGAAPVTPAGGTAP